MYIPEVDMLQVSKNSRRQRNEILTFNPPGFKLIDYGEMRRLDMFFLSCQDLRDYYRDPHNKLHKPSRFHNQGPCGVKPDRVVKNFLEPVVWVTKTKPVFNFIEKSSSDLDRTPWALMMGRNNARSCTRYKR